MTLSIAPSLASSPDKANTSEPQRDCFFCPRLADFRQGNRRTYPDWFNSPVPSFGPRDASLLIVGLAPGLKGANRTGRPFTGDYAGLLLYETLLAYGFAQGVYEQQPHDGLTLSNCRITNAVRCVPPENKPTPDEVAACRGFLAATLKEMPKLRAILVLGRIAFDATLRALALKPSQYKFNHGAALDLGGGLKLFGSYHCSRYNTSTGRLTPEMFRDVFDEIAVYLKSAAQDQ